MYSQLNDTTLEVIVNPASRSGRGVKAWNKIKPYFDETGVSYRVHFSGKGKGISDMVRRLTSKQSSDIVIIGGDGSFNEAVNGITDFETTRLAFIPIGSGNDLARALDIQKNYRELVKTIAELKTVRQLDIGVLEADGKRRLFNISSGMGFDALICRSANISPLKTFLNRLGAGKLIYIMTALKLILKNERFSCEIRTGDGRLKTFHKCLFAVCMNQKYEGGGYMFCPDADSSDGLLDFCVIDNIGSLKFFFLFPKALKGAHVKRKEVSIFRARSATIRTTTPQYCHVDGEVDLNSSKLSFSILYDKLKLLM